MKSFWKLAGLAALVALLAVAMVGAVAFAQETDDGQDSPFNWRERLHTAIAGALGIGVDEYDAAVDTAREQVLDEAVAEGLLTEEQAELMRERLEAGIRGRFFGRRGGVMGFGGRGGMMAGPDNSMLSVAAEELGLTLDELAAELKDGKTIADLAADRGVELQTIADAFIASRAEWLADAVAEGRITQQQADWMLEHMEDQVLEHLNSSLPYGGRGGCWGQQGGGSWRGGPGMMGPGRLQQAPGTSDL